MRLAMPTTFIIDPYFTGIILLGLIGSWIFKTRGRPIAIGGLAVLCLYIGIQGYWHQQATEVAQQQARAMQLADADISALPQPGSPLHWKLIIEQNQQYHIAYLNLAGGTTDDSNSTEGNLWTRIMALYRPADALHWETVYQYGKGNTTQQLAHEAWSIPVFKVLHHFMRYPSLFDLETRAEGLCAWFVDQRFVLRGLRAPFRFGACRKQQGHWQAYRYGDDKLIPLF
jgi:inner membrane protein